TRKREGYVAFAHGCALDCDRLADALVGIELDGHLSAAHHLDAAIGLGRKLVSPFGRLHIFDTQMQFGTVAEHQELGWRCLRDDRIADNHVFLAMTELWIA